MPANEYQFLETWHFPGYTPAQVYVVLEDARLLPEWWRGVYLESQVIGDDTEPRVGGKVRVKARGFLPYKLDFILEALKLEKNEMVEVKATGDFDGIWKATLSEVEDGTQVILDWRVTVNMPLIRWLSPIFRPLFAWNHYWTTPKGEQGMMAYLTKKHAQEVHES